MLLSKLAKTVGISLECDTEIENISVNSKNVKENGLFICIKGFHNDSHAYVSEAVRLGAVAIVVERNSQYSVIDGIVYLEVENTRQAAAYLFSTWYGNPSSKMKIVAVTGTNGKTTVVQMLRVIFCAAGYKCASIGTLGCRGLNNPEYTTSDNPLANMTTPDPEYLYKILHELAEQKTEFVFMEASSHSLSLCKLDAIVFDMAIFTNLTGDHLDFHETIENYFQAKAKLFEMCNNALVNEDCKYSIRIIRKLTCPYKTCSASGYTGYYKAIDIKNLGTRGVEYMLSSPNAIFRVRSHIPGIFTVINSLQAAACAIEYKIPPVIIQDALSSLYGVCGRSERVKLDNTANFSVFIDYAHTPDALYNLLCSAKELQKEKGRIVLLFGCGGDRDKSKRSTMGSIASKYCDFFVITSDNSRGEKLSDIINGILDGIDGNGNFVVIEDRKKAIEYLIENAQENDIIILAGKGHEQYQIDIEGRHYFSEREIILEAFEKFKEQKQSGESENEN